MGLITPTVILVFLAICVTAQNGCYYPNGSPSADIPCDSTAPVSMCCGSRSSCLSSGLCLLDGTTAASGISYARGTCTDSTWKSPFCPQHCQLSQETARGNTSAYDFGAGGVQVWECIGEGYADPAAYCCESITEKTRCCQTPEAVFSLPGATIGNAASVQTIRQSSTAAPSSSGGTTAQSTTTARSATSSTEPSAVLKTTGSNTGTGAVDSSRSTGNPAEMSGGSGALSRDATLGIAITIPLVVVAVVAGLVFYWYRRRQLANAAPRPAPVGDRIERWHKPELDGNGVPIGVGAKELDSNNEVKELGPGTPIAEAPGGAHRYPGGLYGNQPVELDTGR
jgi:hypothetical protein